MKSKSLIQIVIHSLFWIDDNKSIAGIGMIYSQNGNAINRRQEEETKPSVANAKSQSK